jgi:uncharacterized protein
MIFVDTLAWVALASEGDQYHALATREHCRLKKRRRPYYTTDYVLSEAITHLYRQQAPAEARKFISGLLEAIDSGIHQLVEVSSSQFRRAWQLRQKYDDKPDISFVDFTSMVVMQDLRIVDVFTGDGHFRQVGLGFRLVP